MKSAATILMITTGLICVTSGCAAWSHQRVAPGSRHVVAAGDTLWSIARRYHIPIAELIEANNVSAQEKLPVGRVLYVPQTQHENIFLGYKGPRQKPPPAGSPVKKKRSKRRRVTKRIAKSSRKTASSKPKSTTKKSSGKRSRNKRVVAKAKTRKRPSTIASTTHTAKKSKQTKWQPQWPVAKATILKRFDSDYGGVALAASLGSRVVAADAGEVMYAGDMGNRYGKIVILKHPPRQDPARFITIYAHLQQINVAKQKVAATKQPTVVTKGQAIGTVGRSGGVATPRLYFQIRKRRSPVNPLHYLNPIGK
ncbi:MAG: M23 family metallopeptidase [Myxococcota bacterium]